MLFEDFIRSVSRFPWRLPNEILAFYFPFLHSAMGCNGMLIHTDVVLNKITKKNPKYPTGQLSKV